MIWTSELTQYHASMTANTQTLKHRPGSLDAPLSFARAPGVIVMAGSASTACEREHTKKAAEAAFSSTACVAACRFFRHSLALVASWTIAVGSR
jgi:hypothetical protein